jgi:hypothetical protein
VVKLKSAYKVMEAITNTNKQLKIIRSDKHGILMDNISDTWNIIDGFMVEQASILK